jgi:DNA-binding transcriptional ArsR family regulator
VINCCTPLAGSSLDEGRAAQLEAVMKALADRQRLRIVNMLLRAGGEAV